MNKIKCFLATLSAWVTVNVITPAWAIGVAPGKSLDDDVTVGEFAEYFSSLRGLGTIISGICTMIALIAFIINLTKLSASAGNDRARSTAMKGVLFSGIGLSLFGGITLIIGVFWNIF